MTKKHFKALSAALNGAKPVGNPIETQDVLLSYWEDLVARIANVCREINPRFDREKFYAACDCRPGKSARARRAA